MALLAYAALLVFLAREAGAPPPQEPARLAPHSVRDVAGLLRGLTRDALVETARFLPIGLLAVLAVPRRQGWLERLLKLWVPAVALAFLLAVSVLGLSLGQRWSWPGALDVAFPLLGCLVGAWIGMAWTRGWSARLWIVPKLALLLLLVPAGVGLLLYLAAESAPLGFEPAAVSSAERRRLYRLFKDKNPARIPPGKTVELSLGARDLGLLLAWGLSLGEPGRKAKVELGDDTATLSVSARLPAPGLARYLNVVVSGEAGVTDGRLRLRTERLRIGRLETPHWVLNLASPLAARTIGGDRRVTPLLAPIRSLDLRPAALTVSYGHAAPPKGFLAELFRGEAMSEEEVASIQAQIRHLMDAAKGFPPGGETRFGQCLETAFRFARERSRGGQAVRESRAAILALGMLLGHWRVEMLVGRVTDPGQLQRGVRTLKGTTLRGRDDWPKHFFVSASLTVLSISNVSEAAGLLKEELDAGGGSGFSFGDLLADRAGTTFARAATRDEASARAMQERLARGFRVDDLFPPATGLPEGLQEAELQARYGGVGGEGYRRLSDEIDRRIAACAAYRQ